MSLPSIVRRPAVALAVLALTMGLVAWRFGPPSPRGDRAPPDRFSAARATAALETVVGTTPHPTGSAAHRAVRERLEAHLRGLGLEPTRQRAARCNRFAVCADLINVVAELPGSSDRAILLATHYDSVPASPGAADDGAGVAALLEVARALRRDVDRSRSVILLFSDGEELGLLGARAFVDEHPAMDRVDVVLNLEARGVRGPSMMFETAGPSARLAPYLRTLPRAVTSSLMDAVYQQLPNDTDFSVFRDAGKPGFNFAFLRGFSRYHTPEDDLAHLDRGSLQHHGDNVLTLTRALLAAPLSPEDEAGDAVWFELLGWLWWYPATWAVPLAGLAAALVLGAMARAASREPRFFLRYSRGLGALLATSLLTLGLGVGVARLLYARVDGLAPEHAAAGFGAAGVVLGSVAVGAAVLRKTTGGCGPRAATTAGWSLWALFGALSSTTLPAASHLFVIPTLLAGAIALATTSCAASTRIHAMLGPQVLAAILWGEALLGLRDVFNLAGVLAVGPMLGLWFATSAGHWVEEMRRGANDAEATTDTGASKGARRLGFAAFTGTAALVVAAALQPAADAADPQRMSIAYYQAGDTAQWWVDASFGAVPDSVREAGKLGAPSASPHPFLAFTRAATGATKTVGLSPPRVEVVAVDDTRVRLRARSQRGAHLIAVMVPPSVPLPRARVDGVDVRPFALADSPLFPGFRSVASTSSPADGVAFDLILGAAPPTSLLVMDVTFDLPGSAAPLTSARGARGLPSQNGDASVVVSRVSLEPKPD